MNRRILLTLSLFAGFYAVGLALVLLLLWLPWAQVAYTGELGPSGIATGLAAVYLCWAMVPPRVRWTPPGPELSPADHPELYALVDEVARRSGHARPRALYLIMEANAFAGSRPRWKGLVREPIVGIGLPLFVLLDQDQLTAVVAHEFGHHMGGDVRLGPWHYRTHHAIAAALHRLEGSSLYLHLPFYLYGRLFLRVSGATSREQELRADQLAAGLAGPRALAGALIALEERAPAWSAYWHGVFVPAVEAGFRPPLLEGLQRLLAVVAPRPEERAVSEVSAEDTHPPLSTRLAALGVEPFPLESPPAGCRSLLSNVARAEGFTLARLLTNPSAMGSLKPARWEDWGTHILPAIWHAVAGERSQALAQIPLLELPSLLESEHGTWQQLRGRGLDVYSPEARRRLLSIWLGQWAALSLLKAGLRVVSEPGTETTLAAADVRVEPFRWVAGLAKGERSAEDWRLLVDRALAAARTSAV